MEAVRRIRKERGLSQQALSELAGINKVTLVHIETGKSSPNVDTLEKLARALDVEVADFFPKAEPSLFPPEIVSPEQGRLEPTPYELHAIETLAGFCDRLEEFLAVAERIAEPSNTWTALWSMQVRAVKDMAAVSLALVERESVRPLLLPVGARLVKLADKVFDEARKAKADVTDEEAKQSRDQIRILTQEIA